MYVMEYIKISQVNFSENIGNRLFLKFLVRDVDVRKQKDGVTDYITFNMVEKDTVVEAKIFGATQQQIDMVKAGTVCIGAVDVKPYAKATTGYSCIIYNIDITDENSSDYITWSDGIEEGYNVIQSVLNDIIDTLYGKITYEILMSKWQEFSTWTAAKGMHHTSLGGLLVHTSEVASLCDVIGRYFNSIYNEKFVNLALAKAGALLHDWGKIFELDVDINSGSSSYSLDASLESHIMSILTEIDIVCYKNNYGKKTDDKSDDELKIEIEQIRLLKHLVASHHGKLEWGSPIAPTIPEAYILHIADNLSAEMFKYNKEFKKLDNNSSSVAWTSEGMKVIYKAKDK